jgi:FAD/FMN-containing dehydrogenase
MTTTTTARRFEASGLEGRVVTPDSPDYDEVRALWNGMLDRRPAAIVRCRSAADVAIAIRAARAAGSRVCVRGGGHNVAGSAVLDDSVVVDLTEMTAVTVDAERRRARVGGGARWRDVDAATQAFGLATPGGVVSDTGVAGLTLGGGLGWLRRAFGLACDAVVGAEVVTADGAIIRTDETEHPDLLWALKGGGGNFGVVTELEFALEPLGPDVATALVAYALDDAHTVMRTFRDIANDLPDEVSAILVFGAVPAAEPFPEEHWSADALLVLGMASTHAELGMELLAPLQHLGAEPIADAGGVVPYVEWQKVFDEDYPAGELRYYWKSAFVDDLSDDAIAVLVEATRNRPSPHSTIDVWPQGGAMARVGDDESSFGGRDVPWLVSPEANWEHEADDDENLAWGRGVVAAMQPYSPGGTYLNFAGFLDDAAELVEPSYGRLYARLREVKRRYDPENVFSANVNITPA